MMYLEARLNMDTLRSRITDNVAHGRESPSLPGNASAVFNIVLELGQSTTGGFSTPNIARLPQTQAQGWSMRLLDIIQTRHCKSLHD